MIKSLLDSDLYKLTMQSYAYHFYPNVDVKYEFKCRTKGIDFNPFLRHIENAIAEYRQLRFTADELSYLQSKPYFQKDFINYLANYRNDNNRVQVYIDKNNELQIDVSGDWVSTILLEVPILAIVNESYFTYGKDRKEIDKWLAVSMSKLDVKIAAVKNDAVVNSKLLKIIEFGSRRRFSFENQFAVTKKLVEEIPNNIIGTSNVLIAKMLGIEPKGTNAHEHTMIHQALVRVEDSQKVALQGWMDEFRGGQLSIALADTLGLTAFKKDFDHYFATLYSGIRQDSGDPIWFYEEMVAHYEKLGIDPKTKTILFSDGLTIDSAIAIKNKVDKMIPLFGIGTHLSNDVGLEPLQIVMKLTEANGGKPVAKISEARGKTMCNDPVYLEYLKKVFKIQ